MALTPVFVSFDYDHDLDLKTMLVGQAKQDDTPFAIADWSVKNASPTWVQDARARIKRVDQVIVLCGNHTGSATGIDVEIKLARELGKPYFLLGGRATGVNQKPRGALSSDKIYDWTWPNLKKLIGGAR